MASRMRVRVRMLSTKMKMIDIERTNFDGAAADGADRPDERLVPRIFPGHSKQRGIGMAWALRTA
jgi:hypothetical protein